MINRFADIFGMTCWIKMEQENNTGALTKQSNKQLTLITAGSLAFRGYAYQVSNAPHADFPQYYSPVLSNFTWSSGASEKSCCPSLAATSAGAGDHRHVMCCPP